MGASKSFGGLWEVTGGSGSSLGGSWNLLGTFGRSLRATKRSFEAQEGFSMGHIYRGCFIWTKFVLVNFYLPLMDIAISQLPLYQFCSSFDGTTSTFILLCSGKI